VADERDPAQLQDEYDVWVQKHRASK
jgi:hypothetical protein